LFIAKIYASLSSNSLSIISSAVDSFLDLFSGAVLWWTTRKSFTNPYDYPAGKKTRLEPLGVIIFSAVMGTAVLQLVSQAGEQIHAGIVEHMNNKDSSDTSSQVYTREQLHILDLAIIIGVIVVKFFLWVFCKWWVRNSSSVAALAQDHRNDVFTNSFALLTAFLGARTIFWWFDALGAGLIGLYIVVFWARSGFEQVKFLAGYRAKRLFQKQLIYLVWNHHPLIKHIDTVRAFHFGAAYIVEIDVVLPAETPLRESHDIGESLQITVEGIPEVDRAYVHLDYEFSHKPEHQIAENVAFLVAEGKQASPKLPRNSPSDIPRSQPAEP